jgi:DNA-binding PadR family transcriptional regulator
MERGVLRYLLLAALRDGPKHGYELIKWLEGRTHGFYSPSPGTVYPTLQLLEDQGLVRAESQEERRVYHLTDAGRAELEAHAGTVEAVWSRFAGGAPSGASRHEAAFLHDELQDLHRTIWEGLRGPLDAGDGQAVRQVRQALERCKNEVREIIARAAGGDRGPGGPGGPEAPDASEGPAGGPPPRI